MYIGTESLGFADDGGKEGDPERPQQRAARSGNQHLQTVQQETMRVAFSLQPMHPSRCVGPRTKFWVLETFINNSGHSFIPQLFFDLPNLFFFFVHYLICHLNRF